MIIFNNKFNKMISLLLMFAVLIGCKDIRVSDAAGNPIPDAEIYSISLSMNIGPSLTNAQGLGNVPANIQGTKWVSVSKAGYETVQLDWPQKTPVHVVLPKK